MTVGSGGSSGAEGGGANAGGGDLVTSSSFFSSCVIFSSSADGLLPDEFSASLKPATPTPKMLDNAAMVEMVLVKLMGGIQVS